MKPVCACVVVDIDESRVTANVYAALSWECQCPMCVACLCERDSKCVYALCLCVCVCVYLWEPCWSALAKQRSVQYRSDVGWADLTEPRPSTNPAVFRSPGPYLMSLGKKRGISFSRSLFSFSFPLALSFSLSFSHAPPLKPQPCLEPVCKWMSSKCLLSSSLSLFSFFTSLSTLTDIAEVNTKLNFKHLLQHRKVQLA